MLLVGVCVCAQGYERVRRVSEDDLSSSVVHDEEEGGLEDQTGRESNTQQVTHPKLHVGLLKYLLFFFFDCSSFLYLTGILIVIIIKRQTCFFLSSFLSL